LLIKIFYGDFNLYCLGFHDITTKNSFDYIRCFLLQVCSLFYTVNWMVVNHNLKVILFAHENVMFNLEKLLKLVLLFYLLLPFLLAVTWSMKVVFVKLIIGM